MNPYKHLGIYSDFVDAAKAQQPLFPEIQPGFDTRQRIRENLGFTHSAETPLAVQVNRTWKGGGVLGEEISWWVGYGPRTHAWLLRPEGIDKPLPGILALHDHGGFKYYGKEKIADGPEEPNEVIRAFRDPGYGGRAYANVLAKEGFVVLVHDTFLWGSRKFPLETMLEAIGNPFAVTPSSRPSTLEEEIAFYNSIAGHHEHLVSKYCNLLGTSMAGVVCHEDRIAMNYLRSRREVIPEKTGCIGLSGGGNRAALLQATYEEIGACVIVGLMSTYEGCLDHNIACHTWMLFPFQLSRIMDWSDLAASHAPKPLLVQYDLDDELFTVEGMRSADERIARHYKNVGHPEAYCGQFYPGPHKFDLEMQSAAFEWLKYQLR